MRVPRCQEGTEPAAWNELPGIKQGATDRNCGRAFCVHVGVVVGRLATWHCETQLLALVGRGPLAI